MLRFLTPHPPELAPRQAGAAYHKGLGSELRPRPRRCNSGRTCARLAIGQLGGGARLHSSLMTNAT